MIDNSLFNSAKRKKFVDTPGKADAIEANVDSLWGKKRKGKGKLNCPDHWSGVSIRERARNFGPLYEQEYLEIYSLLSSYAHGGNAAYSGLSEAALESVYGISLELARKMYIESLLICSKIFNLGDAIESFSQIVSFLENAPRQILTEYGLKKVKHSESS